MKKRIFACVVVITIISMLMIGCTSVNSTDETSDRIDNKGTMTLLVDENGKPKL